MIKAFRYILIITVISLLSSCAKEESRESSIPPRLVVIDINVLIENNFNNLYYTKKYYNNTPPVVYAGYGGVLAITSTDRFIYAYDLCCPYEAPVINEIQMLNSLQAECPKCKTVYEVANGSGRVASGPGTERLKAYRVMKDASFFRIRN